MGTEISAECCGREIQEVTGYRTKAVSGYLDIEALFDVRRHIPHCFMCELIKDTGCQHLTEAYNLQVIQVFGYLCTGL